MSELTHEEKREFLVNDLVKVWTGDLKISTGKKLMNSLTKIMVFVGGYRDFAGADKKKETLAILELLLEKTDSPGPDFVVDKAILWIADYAIDSLYDAFKGKFDFDGGA